MDTGTCTTNFDQSQDSEIILKIINGFISHGLMQNIDFFFYYYHIIITVVFITREGREGGETQNCCIGVMTYQNAGFVCLCCNCQLKKNKKNSKGVCTN